MLPAVLTFFIVFFLVLVVYQGVTSRKVAIAARLNSIRDMEIGYIETEPLSLPFRIRILKPMETKIVSFFYRLLPANLLSYVERKLVQAGNPRGLRAQIFVSGILLTVLIAAPLGIIIPVITGMGIKAAFWGAAAGVFLPVLFPAIWLYAAANKRVKEIDRSLPDAIDLMVVCVEAGLGFDMAMVRVTERIKGPLSEEFSKALNEIKVGKTRQEALRDLSRRVDSHNLSSFLSMVIQGTQMGVTMGRILRIQSDTMRQVRRQKAEEKAMKAPIKMVFPLVFFIFPALFIVILGPAVIQILNSGLFK